MKRINFKLVAFLAFICTAVMILTACVSKSADDYNYEEAEALYKAGDYEEAAQIYYRLSWDNFKDSEQKYRSCKYEQGKQLLSELDYSAARMKFDEADGYEDAQDLVSLCEAELSYASIMARIEKEGLSDKCDLQLVSGSKYSISKNKYGGVFGTKAEFSSEGFSNLTNVQKISVFEIIAKTYLSESKTTITSGGDVYGYRSDLDYKYLIKNGDEVYKQKIVYQSSGSSSGSSGKCATCNGSGYVRYYSAGSDLESYLSGLDSYTSGKCPSCDGSGR